MKVFSLIMKFLNLDLYKDEITQIIQILKEGTDFFLFCVVARKCDIIFSIIANCIEPVGKGNIFG